MVNDIAIRKSITKIITSCLFLVKIVRFFNLPTENFAANRVKNEYSTFFMEVESTKSMNQKTKIYVVILIFAAVGVDLFLTYLTNSKIDSTIESSIPSYIPKCDKIPAFRGDLRQCNFQNTVLKGTDLTGLNFELSNLKGTNLRDVNLNDVDLQMADLQGADLSGASLKYAYLYNANLTKANLTGANFYHAHLIGVDLTGAIITNTNFTNATFHVDGLEGRIKPQCLNNPTCK